VVDDEVERIGEASHDRFIIDLNRFSERLDQKLKQA
jgi:predicted thioesterase